MQALHEPSAAEADIPTTHLRLVAMDNAYVPDALRVLRLQHVPPFGNWRHGRGTPPADSAHWLVVAPEAFDAAAAAANDAATQACSAEAIGLVALWRMHGPQPELRTAVDAAHRGLHLAAKAAQGVLRHAFHTLRLPAVYAFAEHGDWRCRRFLRRIGMAADLRVRTPPGVVPYSLSAARWALGAVHGFRSAAAATMATHG